MSVILGLWGLGAVFASAGQMRKLTTNATGGKPVGRGRWRRKPDTTDTDSPVLAAHNTEESRQDLTALGGFGRLGVEPEER